MFPTRPPTLAFATVFCLCIGFPAQSHAGDFDGNSIVNSYDQAIFQDVLLGRTTDPAYLDVADVNRDGVADGRDIAPFMQLMMLSGQSQLGGPQDDVGACCFQIPGTPGLCIVIPESFCESQGGTYFGAGTTCNDPNIGCQSPPPPLVACCLPNGNCVMARPVPCVMMMGVPQGPFTNCNNTSCEVPPPTGACCVSFFGLPSNACFVTTQSRCEADGGSYQGDDVGCDSPNIPCSPPPPPTGACCFLNGACQQLPFLQCLQQGGQPRPPMTQCDSPGICNNDPVGACCRPPSGGLPATCAVTTQTQCTSGGGSYQGDGSTCTDSICLFEPPGACCLPPSPISPPGNCLETTESQCIAQGGNYFGNGSSCNNTSCPNQIVGRCCFLGIVPEPVLCQVTTQAQCAQFPAPVSWTPGETCEGDPCNDNPPTGACCVATPVPFPDGGLPGGGGLIICVDTSAFQCAQFGGAYQGDDTSCDDEDIACPQPEVGACCLLAPGAPIPCVETTEAQCGFQGGTYLGDNTVCSPNTICPQPPTGACCRPPSPISPPGNCVVTTPEQCAAANGTYLGDGTTCLDPMVPCPTQPMGACCTNIFDPGGGTQPCIVATEMQCMQFAGSYQGDGTSCDDDNIPCQPIDTGACCGIPTGSPTNCLVTTEAACNLQGGIYLGDDTICSPNIPCPDPLIGACCRTNVFGGVMCSETSEAQCLQQGGSYRGNGTSCNTPGICDSGVLGRCCFLGIVPEPALCSVSTQAECFSNTVPVSWTPGENCEGDPCNNNPPRGACCVPPSPISPPGNCLETSPEQCAANNGSYQGDGTNCLNTLCPTPVTGACCISEIPGSLFCDQTTEVQCNQIGGDYQGDGTICTSAGCPQPATGACCVQIIDPNGGSQSCVVVSAAQCAQLNGSYQGDGSSCDDDGIPCPPMPTGACCINNPTPIPEPFGCFETTQANCMLNGGNYQGDGTSCTATGICEPIGLGRCCFVGFNPEIVLCEVTTETLCYHSHVPISWTAGDTCEGDHPCDNAPIGACCVDAPGTPVGVCINVTAAECAAQGGDYLGDNSTCPFAGCPSGNVGACCLNIVEPGPDGGVPPVPCIVTTATQCAASGGVYQGDDTACDDDGIDCPPSIVGACCVTNIPTVPPGGCIIVTAEQCAAEDGEYLGDNSTCPFAGCPIGDVGACCIYPPFGPFLCIDTSAEACAAENGEFAGVGTSCSDPFLACPPPPTGACCIGGIGGFAPCVEVTANQCTQYPGDYQGDGTICSPTTCPVLVVGACCVPSVSPEGGGVVCIVTSEPDCFEQFGQYQGHGTSCDSDEIACPTPAIGACCLSFFGGTDSCLDTTELNCFQQLGSYQGDGTTCLTPGICDNGDLGRCCFLGIVADPPLCDITTESACFQLPAPISWTPNANCEGDPCIAPITGACCANVFGNLLGCGELTEENCLSIDGTYLGDGTVCAPGVCPQPVTGACCSDIFGNPLGCGEMTEENCLNIGGAYLGDNTSCAPGLCPGPNAGACCIFPPFGPYICLDTDAAGCAAQHGEFAGVGTACGDPNLVCPSAPRGACCIGGSGGLVACIDVSANQCAQLMGVYQGDGNLCAFGPPCPVDSARACCLPNGQCQLLTPEVCEQQGGMSQPLGVTCQNIICVGIDIGACCLPDGGCVNVPLLECLNLNGGFVGPGVDCTVVDCLPTDIGACCLNQPGAVPCLELTSVDCEAHGGVYQGPGTVCTNTLCGPTPMGACCLQTKDDPHQCMLLTQTQCNRAGGEYLGNGVACIGPQGVPVCPQSGGDPGDK